MSDQPAELEGIPLEGTDLEGTNLEGTDLEGTTSLPAHPLAAALEAQRERLLPCVHCGFCLPACPTYARLGDEADSPRGRLHLMGAVVDGRLDPASDAFRTHIDRCLGCRACEPVCPSGVEYGTLLELARDVAARSRPRDLPTRALLAVFGLRPARAAFFLGGRVLRATGLATFGARVLPGGGLLGSARLGLAMLASTRGWGGLGWMRTAVPSGRPEGVYDAEASRAVERLRAEIQASRGVPGPRAASISAPGAPPPDTGAPPLDPDADATETSAAEDSPTESDPEARAHTPLTRPEDADTLVVPPNATPGAGEAETLDAAPRVGAPEPPHRTPRSAVPPDWTPRRGDAAPAPTPGSAGRVALLTGCVQEGLYDRVNDATVRVLEANGYAVVRVAGQDCCGALHAHGGDLDQARRLARTNVAAFDDADLDAVVVNAAGCGAAMKEYGVLLGGGSASRVAARVRDVTELLAAAGPRVGAPVPTVVAYDHPCHLLHAQRVEHPPLRVLAAVPGVEVRVIRDSAECCGGAGIYGLTHPDLGGRIGRDKVDAVRAACAEVAATPNPGCMMQIGGGLRLVGAEEGVIHPVELLDESYRRAGFYDAGRDR